MDKITFYDEETNEEVVFEIIDQLKIDDKHYLLVADEEDEALILKVVKDNGQELTYEIVEDQKELQKVTLLLLESDEYDIEV